jgi:hypothetical protein
MVMKSIAIEPSTHLTIGNQRRNQRQVPAAQKKTTIPPFPEGWLQGALPRRGKNQV